MMPPGLKIPLCSLQHLRYADKATMRVRCISPPSSRPRASRSWFPLIAGELEATDRQERDALDLEKALLQCLFSANHAARTSRDLTPRIQDSMPRHALPRRQRMEGIADESGLSWNPAQRCNLTVGRDPATRNPADGAPDPQVERRDGPSRGLTHGLSLEQRCPATQLVAGQSVDAWRGRRGSNPRPPA